MCRIFPYILPIFHFQHPHLQRLVPYHRGKGQATVPGYTAEKLVCTIGKYYGVFDDDVSWQCRSLLPRQRRWKTLSLEETLLPR